MDTRLDLAAQLEYTKNLLEQLTDQVERNTAILRRSQERELNLLRAEDLSVLFDCMLSGLAQSYGLDANTVVLKDAEHDIRHLLLAGPGTGADLSGLVFVEALDGLAPQYAELESPWLGPYSRAAHGLILPDRCGIKSAAIIPLRRQDRLLGSLNFGSVDAERFTPAHASDFFAHLGVIASFALENALNRARLTRSGFTDVLTGWYNRRYLEVRLKEELGRARREGGALTCLMLDVDHFKQINDRYGHAAGDRVLKEVAKRIESQIRVTDVAARYGGEEFVMLLPDTAARAGALLASRIRESVAAEPIEVGGGETVFVTASIGISSERPAREAADLKSLGDALIERADVALYQAKSAGRNRVVTSSDD